MSKELPLYGFGGGGGAGLNFKVTAYATEAALLAATPAENTIGVITTTAITSWLFGAEEPDSPAAGMVWIITGRSSPASFNALKKNGVMVYPLSAMQYVGGAWVDVPARSYQGGAWVEWWTGQLYENGNEWESITGGWTFTPMHYSSDAKGLGSSPTITKGSSNITMQMPDASGALIYPSNKFDLSDVDAIVFDGKIDCTTNFDSLCRIGVWSDIGTYIVDNCAAFSVVKTSFDGELKLDVSELSGEYYVGIALWTATPVVQMRSMILE